MRRLKNNTLVFVFHGQFYVYVEDLSGMRMCLFFFFLMGKESTLSERRLPVRHEGQDVGGEVGF